MNALCLTTLLCLSLASFTAGSPLVASIEKAIGDESEIEFDDEVNVLAPAVFREWFREKWNRFKRSQLGQWLKKQIIERVQRWR